jgi:hypothetical protein
VEINLTEWHLVLEVFVHGQLAPLLGAVGRENIMAEGCVRSFLKAARKQ